MNVHTDWTGTRVETNNTCLSIEEFVDKLWNYLKEESDRMNEEYEYTINYIWCNCSILYRISYRI